jgi:3-hydroxyacyl-CoA dehydrogenase
VTVEPSSVVGWERRGRVALITIDNPFVNASSVEVRRGLLEAIAAVDADRDVDAAVLIGAGNTFVSGSDLRQFEGPLPAPQLPAVIAAVEASPKPFVVAVHDSALGGGLELALGCDARVASADASLGLPEVTLGIIPGAGGTQRLSRLMGLGAALELAASGRRISARQAGEVGLVDEVVEGHPEAAALALAEKLVGEKRPSRALPVGDEDASALADIERSVLTAGRHRPAVLSAVASARAAATEPFDEALRAERQEFERLRASPEAAALRHLFFAERRIANDARELRAEARRVSTVGVVGAGTLGVQIAAAAVASGLDVVLIDRDNSAVARGGAALTTLHDGMVRSGRIEAAERDRRLGAVRTSADVGAVGGAELVVEAAFEDLATKLSVFRALDEAAPGAILASNTSYLPLDDLAHSTRRPQEVVGLHFFAPAHVMRVVEVAQGVATGAPAMATALAFVVQMDELGLVVSATEGYVGNRLFAAYRRQCELLLEDGAFPEEIDAALIEFGFAMGPFAVADLSGLDIAWSMRKRLAPRRDPRERYVAIPDRLCERGWLGQKAGRGWYRYEPGARTRTPDPEVRAIVEAASAEKGIVRRAFSADEIVERVLAAIVNEAALVLGEGTARRHSDVDVLAVHGYGFPRHHGGPVYAALRPERRDRVLAALDPVEETTGFGFRRGDLAVLEPERMGPG